MWPTAPVALLWWPWGRGLAPAMPVVVGNPCGQTATGLGTTVATKGRTREVANGYAALLWWPRGCGLAFLVPTKTQEVSVTWPAATQLFCGGHKCGRVPSAPAVNTKELGGSTGWPTGT